MHKVQESATRPNFSLADSRAQLLCTAINSSRYKGFLASRTKVVTRVDDMSHDAIDTLLTPYAGYVCGPHFASVCPPYDNSDIVDRVGSCSFRFQGPSLSVQSLLQEAATSVVVRAYLTFVCAGRGAFAP